MAHKRVIPRDFFNEAKLLKCMGLLALKILEDQTPEGITIDIEESGEPFDIVMLDEGALTVINYPVTVNGLWVTMLTIYNSKESYPFYCQIDYVEYLVFNDAGEFDAEFINYFTD